MRPKKPHETTPRRRHSTWNGDSTAEALPSARNGGPGRSSSWKSDEDIH